MVAILSTNTLPCEKTIATSILSGFNLHFSRFVHFTEQARAAFNNKNWTAINQLNAERIQCYDEQIDLTLTRLNQLLPDSELDTDLWKKIKAVYHQLLSFHPQIELAETFYNSIFCKRFHRRYFNNEFIFVKTTLSPTLPVSVETQYRSFFPVTTGLKPMIKQVIASFNFETEFMDLDRDIRLLVSAFYKQSSATRTSIHKMRFDILKQPFYRNKAAYLIGRVVTEAGVQPFVIPILHYRDQGLTLDALLTNSDQMRVIFGFARAYFMVKTDAPSALVHFLSDLMPGKTLAELYNAIGMHKQGKTEFYRELLEHLTESQDEFVAAPGIKGMVMSVFTLPSFPYVFKIIKDEFGETKPISRQTVRDRYQLVKRHDRVGRMADTMEFSNVALPLDRFSTELLKELRDDIASSMEYEDNLLIIKHLYIERRMTPLNLYLKEANIEQQTHAIDEFGQALKEMIAANIFPGDMLLKNFGVTQHQRVVFYDYDEVQYLEEMNFRTLPKADDTDLYQDSYISVAPKDVFPEQISTYATYQPELKRLFERIHPELLTVEYWQAHQKNIRQGKIASVFPYPEKQRFKYRWKDKAFV